MKKSSKRLLGVLALAAGALGGISAYMKRNKVTAKPKRVFNNGASVWARPGMTVTFRAELMPGREKRERTVRVKTLLPSGRVLLEGVAGEHAEKEFERIL